MSFREIIHTGIESIFPALRRTMIPASGLLLALGCSSPDDDFVTSSDAQLSAVRALDQVCSRPVVSPDGKYAIIDQCVKSPVEPGSVVRMDLATGATTTLATLSTGDEVVTLSANFGMMTFRIHHFTSDVSDVHAFNWTLTKHRVFNVAGRNGFAISNRTHLAFSNKAGEIFVAPLSGTSQASKLSNPVDGNFEATSDGFHSSAHVGFSIPRVFTVTTSGGTIVESPVRDLANSKLELMDNANWTENFPTASPFDGKTWLGIRQSANDERIVAWNPMTNSETNVTASSGLYRANVIFVRTREVGGIWETSLVATPRVGGAETVLVQRTAATKARLPSLSLTGWAEDRAYALVAIVCSDATCARSYELVKLDGSTSPVVFGPSAFPLGQNGAMLLVRAGTSMEVIDLDRGTHTPLVGVNSTNMLEGSPLITATGSVALVAACNGSDGGMLLFASTSAPVQSGPCSASLNHDWRPITVPNTEAGLFQSRGRTRVSTLLVLKP
jgi:hypothetical protein